MADSSTLVGQFPAETKTVAMTTEGMGIVEEVDGEGGRSGEGESSSADEWVQVELPQDSKNPGTCPQIDVDPSLRVANCPRN